MALLDFMMSLSARLNGGALKSRQERSEPCDGFKAVESMNQPRGALPRWCGYGVQRITWVADDPLTIDLARQGLNQSRWVFARILNGLCRIGEIEQIDQTNELDRGQIHQAFAVPLNGQPRLGPNHFRHLVTVSLGALIAGADGQEDACVKALVADRRTLGCDPSGPRNQAVSLERPALPEHRLLP